MSVEHIVGFIIAIILGMGYGNVATMAQYRLPRGKPWSSLEVAKGEPIACPKCHHILTFKDYCPIIGFCLSKGKCKYCGAPIEWYYVFTELMIVVASVVHYGLFGFGQLYVPYTLMAACLVVLFVTQHKYQILPGKVIAAMFLASVIYRMLMPDQLYGIVFGGAVGYIAGAAIYKLIQSQFKVEALLVYQLFAIAGVWLALPQLAMFLITFFGFALALRIYQSLHRNNKISGCFIYVYSVSLLINIY